MTKKLILLLATCLLATSCLFGCGDDTKLSDDNPTTTEKVESTTPPETTTEKPTIPEETTKYVYKGIRFSVNDKSSEYFNGLILENGDLIYVNDIYPGESYDDDCGRGSTAYAILSKFKMEEEKKSLKDKYWTEGTFTPEIPYSDNYCIKYTGEKVEFVLAEKLDGGVVFDVIPVE